MDNYKAEFLSQINEEEIKRMSEMAKANEEIWLEEYITLLRKNKYWDVEVIDYKCYKVFVSEYIEDIDHYRDEFINNGGQISFDDAGWGLYYIATNQEHKLISDPAEA